MQAALSEHEAKIIKTAQQGTLGIDSGVGEDRDTITRSERDMDLTGDAITPMRTPMGPDVRSKRSDTPPVPSGMEAAALLADQRSPESASTPFTPLGEYALRYRSTSTPLSHPGGGRRSQGASFDRQSHDRNPARQDSSVRWGGLEQQPADDDSTRRVSAQLNPATSAKGTGGGVTTEEGPGKIQKGM